MASGFDIDWVEICRNPHEFERLVKLLLQRMYPSGEIIDGRGGDGGREFQIRTESTLTVYEAKSFTGRVSVRNPVRRRQVERSLVSVANLQPDAWNLVVPIDHDPWELAWFDGLRAGDFPFIAKWHGQGWLEEQLSKHDDLVRFATENRLLRYVRLNKIETEALAGGVPQLAERHRALQGLGDELDPWWRPTVRRDSTGGTTMSLEPKHDDSAEQAPIRFNVGLNIPDAPEHDELRAAIELGAAAHIPGEFISNFSINAPGSLGLGANSVPSVLEIEPLPNPEVAQRIEQTLTVYAPGGGVPLVSVQFVGISATSGSAGMRVIGTDLAGTAKLTTDVRGDRVKINLVSQEFDAMAPSALLPSLRLASALRPPNILVLRVKVDDVEVSEQQPIATPFLNDPPDNDFIQFVEDLAVIQDKLCQYFPLPEVVEPVDLANTRRLRRLLDGERVQWKRGPAEATVDPDKIDDFKAQFTDTTDNQLRMSTTATDVFIMGRKFIIGPFSLQGSASIDLNTVVPDAAGVVTARFDIGGDGWMYGSIGGAFEEGDTSNDSGDSNVAGNQGR